MRINVVVLFSLILILICGYTNNTIATQTSYAVLLGLNPKDSSVLTCYDTVVIDAQVSCFA